MEIHVNQWGNSLAVRLPKAIVELLGITNGSALEARVENRQLIIEPRQPDDDAYVNGVQETLTEWNSESDEAAFRDL